MRLIKNYHFRLRNINTRESCCNESFKRRDVQTKASLLANGIRERAIVGVKTEALARETRPLRRLNEEKYHAMVTSLGSPTGVLNWKGLSLIIFKINVISRPSFYWLM